jgi:hypothetical protein
MTATMVKRYAEAAHAMQSGVAFEMTISDRMSATEPKYLRVGINAAMCDHTGLVKLLIAKGLITEEEYNEAITTEMEAEKARYEKRISEHLGRKTTLG